MLVFQSLFLTQLLGNFTPTTFCQMAVLLEMVEHILDLFWDASEIYVIQF